MSRPHSALPMSSTAAPRRVLVCAGLSLNDVMATKDTFIFHYIITSCSLTTDLVLAI